MVAEPATKRNKKKLFETHLFYSYCVSVFRVKVGYKREKKTQVTLVDGIFK